MYRLLRRFLFVLPPERSHHIALCIFGLILRVPFIGTRIRQFFTLRDRSLKRSIWGLQFENPVGLAAGFDKDGKYLSVLDALGFGFIEVGTVTPKPQIGNPKPRLFRLPSDRALINRMGFNNQGVEALVRRLKAFDKSHMIIGGNIGKNKDTPLESAISDYVEAFEKLFSFVDYFVVNVSSPNTENLRKLQEKKPLTDLLWTLQKLNLSKETPKPLLLKISPDLNLAQIDDIIAVLDEVRLSGIIVSNTTIKRDNLMTPPEKIDSIGSGGLSGIPLKHRSTKIISYVYQKTMGKLPIIAVGGIHSAEDAKEKLEAGAELVQVYTGLIYSGPALVRNINKLLIGH